MKKPKSLIKCHLIIETMVISITSLTLFYLLSCLNRKDALKKSGQCVCKWINN